MTFQHIQVVWQNARLLLLSYSDRDAIFSANHGDFRERVFLLANLCALVATGDVITRWLAVETSDVPYALKLASDDSSVCKQNHQPAGVELRLASFRLCNFPCNRFVPSWIFGINWT